MIRKRFKVHSLSEIEEYDDSDIVPIRPSKRTDAINRICSISAVLMLDVVAFLLLMPIIGASEETGLEVFGLCLAVVSFVLTASIVFM